MNPILKIIREMKEKKNTEIEELNNKAIKKALDDFVKENASLVFCFLVIFTALTSIYNPRIISPKEAVEFVVFFGTINFISIILDKIKFYMDIEKFKEKYKSEQDSQSKSYLPSEPPAPFMFHPSAPPMYEDVVIN